MTLRRTPLLLFPLVALVLLAGRATSRRAEETARVPEPVRVAMLHQRWDEALGLLDAAAAETPEQADFWLYLRGVALDGADRDDAAIATLLELERDHPDSPWADKARFRRADIHRARREFAEAEAIYGEAARRLRGTERQGELADVYVRFAEQASTPDPSRPDGGAVDYDRAAQLFGKVLDLEAPPAVRDRARFRLAQCYRELGDANRALAAWRDYLAEFDPDRQRPLAEDFVVGAKVWEARLEEGVTLLALNRRAEARRGLEDLFTDLGERLATGAVTQERAAELRDLAARARYEMARTYDEAGPGARLRIAALRRFLAESPRDARSTPAAFEIALLLRGLGMSEAAADAFLAVTERPAPLGDDEEALQRHAELAARALYERGAALVETGRYDDAIAVFEDYTRRHPAGPQWGAAQQAIVDTKVVAGEAAWMQERLPEARAAWQRYLADHPLDERGPQIQQRLGETFASEALQRRREAPEADVAGLYRSALAQWRTVVEKYPGSDVASLALFRSGYVLETELGEIEAAIEQYRACSFGGSSGAARARLELLTQPSLQVVTERTWRSDEAARVTLRTRNVETVEVAIYALDLEAYFRKHLTHRRIEDLDLDLIAPDRRLELPLADYAEFAPLERELDLGLEGPGVWAVAVTADELRATTLVVRSDVDVIVKSSRREVFVFAEDMPAGAPAAGVNVLVALPRSDGPTTLKELVTDAGGVARVAMPELVDSAEVRVLANRDGHFASDGLTLDGLGLSTGLTPRAHVTTDRSVYRPGERVHWRAIVREVVDGAYAFTPGAKIRFEVRDSQGRPLRHGELELSGFGTLHGALELPEGAALGTYAVTIRGDGLPAQTAGFEVQQYELAKVELALEAEAEVVYRGETARVEARASYYYGEPVADAPLVVNLPDGRRLDLRTDGAGVAKFEFETRDFASEGGLGYSATLTEENVTATGTVYLATQGYRAALAVERELVLAGDSFGVTVTATAPSGEKVARELEVEALRRVSRPGGRWSEERALARTVTTDAESGEARLTLALDQGGTWILRATGVDRFGNPITAETSIFVSGDDDATKLRLLADETRVEVGETLRLRLVNRAGPGLALVTFEGETILEHRLVPLVAGENAIELGVADVHYPNFVVSAALMRENSFFAAEASFAVARQLRVQVTPKAESFEPGGDAEVDIVVTDAAGNPVRAELALAVVDDALFRLYPDGAPAIVAFFEAGAVRRAGLRTATSCTFRYEGATTRIADAVLQEAQRMEEMYAWNVEKLEARAGLEALREREVRLRANLAELQDADGVFFAQGAETASDDFYLGHGESRNAPAPGGPSTPGPDRGLVRRAKTQEYFGGILAAPFDGDTAFWTPAVTTDDTGRATLRFKMPDRATRWRLTARGVDAGSLVGEARATLVTRARFFARLRVPTQLTEGDRPRVGVELHDLTGLAGTGRARLVLRAGEGPDAQTQVADVALEGGVVEHRFPALEAIPARDLELVLEVTAERGGEELGARATETCAVRPWGVEVTDAASGPLASSETFWLELPGDARARTLEVFVGPSLEATLVADALGAMPVLRRAERLGGDHVATAGDLLGTCAMLALQGRSGREVNPWVERLRARGQALAAQLVAAQRGDGGWSWTGRVGDVSTNATARVALALGAARAAGLAPDEGALTRAGDAVARLHQNASQGELELRAELTHALAALGRGDFAAANQLHRNRNQLSPAALAHTALALVEMQRQPMAAELVALLEPALLVDRRGNLACSVDANRPWNRGALEMTALAALAVLSASPASPKGAELVESLLAQRPWTEPRGRGLAVAAVALSRSEVARATESLDLRVTLAEGETQALRLEGTSPGRTLRALVPDGAPRRVRVDLEVRGTGTPWFSARLTGFTTDIEAARRESDGAHLNDLEFLAEHPRYRGRAVSPGFGVIERERQTWTNTVSQLVLGGRTIGRINWWIDDAEAPEYWVLEVPLPAGTRVVDGTFSGAQGEWHQRDGALIVPVGHQRGGTVTFEVVGLEPGAFRVLPPRLTSTYSPDRGAIARPRDLTVLGRGEASKDEYRPTPDELFGLGKAMFEAGDRASAREHLTALFGANESNLRRGPLVEAATMLLYLSIEASEPAEIVRYFEIVREKRSDHVVPFAEVLRVAAAYRELKEFERAMLISRAVIEETFGEDLKVVGTLEAQGEQAGGLETLGELVRVYPDLPTVVQAELTLADRRLTLAPNARRETSLLRAGLGRAELVRGAIVSLERFLAVHATDPLAPDAGLNLIGAYLALEDRARTAELAGELAGVFTEPRFLDAFLYSRAVAEWYLGNEEESKSLLERIAAARYRGADGVERPSENRDLALYILGQIHHARQETATAAEYYERVKGVFSDAQDVLDSFREQRIAVEEVTTARPGVGAELVLRHKNVDQAEVLVYAVDLMTLYLREKNLSNVTSVNLAGISPTLRQTFELGGGLELRERETTVKLELNEPGAYLVICRGGALHTSGLVLVSDIELEVHEDPVSGRVRVQALDREDGSYVRGVDVRVVGSADGEFRSGETDPRGLFVADGVRGTATVIARLTPEDEGPEQYAFHRGSTALAEVAQNSRFDAGVQTEYFKNVIDLNRQQQATRGQQLGEEMRRERKGVQVDRVK